jgi:hypothetical protein
MPELYARERLVATKLTASILFARDAKRHDETSAEQ